MTGTPESRSEKARAFYDATAGSATDFVFMNYGYAAEGMPVADASEPERYCQQLYRHVVGSTSLEGKRLLEVSSGRGLSQRAAESLKIRPVKPRPRQKAVST